MLQDSRLHWLVWKPYSGYKDLVRASSVTITHRQGKKWDAEGPEVRSRELLVAAGKQNLPYTEMDRQVGKWEAGFASYLEVQLRLRHSALLDLKITLKLLLSYWPSLRYLGPGPAAKGSSSTTYSKSMCPFHGTYLLRFYINVPLLRVRLLFQVGSLSLFSEEVLFIPWLPSLPSFTFFILCSSFWPGEAKH